MELYCYTAEALSPVLVRNYRAQIGFIVGFVEARSQLEALRIAMNEMIESIHNDKDWSREEMAVTWSDEYGSITVVETQTGKIINHIQKFAVHEC